MNDAQLLRYSRQILLPDFGVEAQERLLNSHALIIGMGGLGSAVAMYLASAGVGRLTLVDYDTVDLSNLQRQIIHGTHDIGRPKIVSAAEKLHALNPEVDVRTMAAKFGDDGAVEQSVASADVVVDCCDNFATRFAVNQTCVKHRTPLVSGAAIRLQGQVSTFVPSEADSPCYRCLFRDQEELTETCSETGIVAPLAGIIGSIQALEAIKVVVGMHTLKGRLLILDAEQMEWHSIRVPKDPMCPVCVQPATGTAAR